MAKHYSSPPAMQIDPNKTYTATFDTAKGKITVNLFAKDAPVTVNNFVFLARDGFYDGVVFHRVVSNFVIQGGDPTGTGRGDPGYKWNDEPSALRLRHDSPGILSMANAGANTNGSQFFITHTPTPHLDGKHAVFGKVADKASMDVVNAIRQGDKINSLTITES
ncbi:MAG: peptidylprolyl isomerase [Anaerolineae bacterium]